MLKREHKVALFVVFAVEAVEFTLLGKLKRERDGGGALVDAPLAALDNGVDERHVFARRGCVAECDLNA